VKVEVKRTSRMPPFALFQTDDVASLSFYFRNRPLTGVDSYNVLPRHAAGQVRGADLRRLVGRPEERPAGVTRLPFPPFGHP